MIIRNYNDLATYVRANASNPLKVAKVMTAWVWTSFHAFSSPNVPPPTDIHDLTKVEYGACGWRALMITTLLEEIGIKTRLVHFWDVPVQGSHVAAELFINGKWMFFDPSFGVYYESKKGVPLSLEEVRAQWPNVVIKHSNLPGWTGERADPTAIDASKTYSTITDTFFEHPGLTNRIDDISGELISLHLSEQVSYRQDGVLTPLNTGGRTWKTYVDTANKSSWKEIIQYYSSNGKLEEVHTTYDNKDEMFVLYDPYNKYDWTKRTIYTRDNYFMKYAITDYDDGHKLIKEYDSRNEFNWTYSLKYYNKSGQLRWQNADYDDGTKGLFSFDDTNGASWTSMTSTLKANGDFAWTYIRYDDGHEINIAWDAANRQTAAAGGSTLSAVAGHNVLQGLEGNDVLVGGSEEDLLIGGKGNDTYYVFDSGTIIFEKPGEGIDTVNAFVNYVLPENVENLYLGGTAVIGVGNDGDNLIVGNNLNNTLRGGAGNDTLIGGLGRDVLYGGPGADVFLWRSIAEVGLGNQADTVMDFNFAEGDRLSFALIDANSVLPGKQSFTFIGTKPFSAPGQIRYAYSGGDTLIQLNTDTSNAVDGVVKIKGVHIPSAAWFIL